jgi:hypothetical protein
MPFIRRCSFLLLGALVFFGGARAEKHTFYVSPTGRDTHPGTLARPLRTLEAARDSVRALRNRQPALDDTVVVCLLDGRYVISRPLEFGPRDGGIASSPTLYAASPGARPVVSGGLPVRPWKERRVNGRVFFEADVSRLGHPGVIRQLWVDGVRRTPARHPNTGYLPIESVPEVTPATDWMLGQKSFIIHGGDIPAAMDLRGAEVMVMNRWVESHLPLRGFSPSENRLTFTKRSVFRLEKGDLYYLLHAPGALDTAGEWLHDRKRGRLIYLPAPGERADRIDAVVPVATGLVRVTGDTASGRWVEHLLFRGITFSHTDWHFPLGTETDSPHPDAGGFVQAATGVPAALELRGARHCTVERCTVSHVGTYGIGLRAGCRHNTVTGCSFVDLGAGGIMIGEKTIAADSLREASGNWVIDNLFSEGGRHFHSAIGIWIGQSPSNAIIHNQIRDFYYTGISIGWTWGYGAADAARNLVYLNHVHHIGVQRDGDGPILSDLGGIYTLGNHRGSLIQQNVFHDIAARVYGGWGIYFDEGTTGIVAEGNLVYRTLHGGFHQHYGRENIVRNNVFAFGQEYQVRRTRPEPHTSFAFENNIVYWKQSKLFHLNIQEGRPVFDRNIYWAVDAEVRPDSLSFAEWQARGFDRHSQVVDPGFVDPESGDFRLRPGSPAIAMGFQPLEIDRALSEEPVGPVVPPPRFTSRRLLYNNDGSNILMAYDTLTPSRAAERIDPLAGSGVTTFLHNVNPGQNMGYPTAVAEMYRWDPPPGEPKEGWGLLGRRMSDNLERLTRDGIDPVRMVVDRARLRGMEVFLTFRMNELHDVDKPASPLLGSFWKRHPAYRVGGYEGWGKEALNYAVPEVRAYFTALLAEVVGRYDVEGLELDFMRFPYYFPYHADSMSSYAALMTEFVRKIRRLTESTGAARGRTIRLSARVPSSLRGCAYLGVDPAAWAREGLIDFLAVAPFLSTETDINAAEFKRVCPGIPVYTGMEFTIGARQMTRQEKRAAAALLYAGGSDGIYLFNYFVAWDAGLDADTEVLRELAHPDSLVRKDKLYTLAIPRYPVPGVSLPGQLPLVLKGGEKNSVTLRTHEPVPPKRAVLRVECSGRIEPGDLRLEWNGSLLGAGTRPDSAQAFPEKIWPASPVRENMLAFPVDPASIRGENRLVIAGAKDLKVEWVHLGVWHSEAGPKPLR